MPRYKLTIEYDGGGYHGWQRQTNGASVQQEIEEAVVQFSGETVSMGVAGRTDTGVHATGQVAHMDMTKEWDPYRIQEALNFFLQNKNIAIVAVEIAPDGFDARFSARARHYMYQILNRKAPLTFQRGTTWHVKRELDAEAMNDAAKSLLGTHDFTTFRNAHCQGKSPIKTLDRLDVVRHGEMIEVYASSRSFLHNQVRSMVGSLVHVGDGKWTKGDLTSALAACERKRCGVVAPPDGLYLIQVDYDDS